MCKIVKALVVFFCILLLICCNKSIEEEKEEQGPVLDPATWKELDETNKVPTVVLGTEYLNVDSIIYWLNKIGNVGYLYLFKVKDINEIDGKKVYQVSLKEIYKVEVNVDSTVKKDGVYQSPSIWYRFIPYMTAVVNFEKVDPKYIDLVKSVRVYSDATVIPNSWNIYYREGNNSVAVGIDEIVFTKEAFKEICKEEDIDSITNGFFSGNSVMGEKIWYFEGSIYENIEKTGGINIDYNKNISNDITYIRRMREYQIPLMATREFIIDIDWKLDLIEYTRTVVGHVIYGTNIWDEMVYNGFESMLHTVRNIEFY